MWQIIAVILAIAGALGYLIWYSLKGRKREGSCPNCAMHEKIEAARKRQPAK